MASEYHILIYQQQLVVDEANNWLHSSRSHQFLHLLSGAEFIDVHRNSDRIVKVVELIDPVETGKFLSYRDLLEAHPEDRLGLISRALQLLTWKKQHRFCGQCGQMTVTHQRESALACPQCDALYYPRISPCIMCLIVREDRCLLAHHRRHAQSVYSTLAGFVEAGESLEQTLHREVFEEVGLGVSRLEYFRSQNWPFPHQLMVGFFATYASGDITVDGEEIVEAQWFHYGHLPQIPPPGTLSGQLISEFVRRRQN
ncbi:MAG: NAD+ diphosphatase [Cellvibrionaceae bacterium]|jgi:NAD+ diphosphatase